jgi:hypothetical protein
MTIVPYATPAESSFFDGEPCKHVADYYDNLRRQRQARKALDFARMYGRNRRP